MEKLLVAQKSDYFLFDLACRYVLFQNLDTSILLLLTQYSEHRFLATEHAEQLLKTNNMWIFHQHPFPLIGNTILTTCKWRVFTVSSSCTRPGDVIPFHNRCSCHTSENLSFTHIHKQKKIYGSSNERRLTERSRNGKEVIVLLSAMPIDSKK